MVKNPAVLVVTDWKSAERAFSPADMPFIVSGFPCSIRKISAAPPKISTAVITSTSLVCRLSPTTPLTGDCRRFKVRRIIWSTSNHTTNPRPPSTISAMVVRFTSGLAEYTDRLVVPRMSIPALQNAEMA